MNRFLKWIGGVGRKIAAAAKRAWKFLTGTKEATEGDPPQKKGRIRRAFGRVASLITRPISFVVRLAFTSVVLAAVATIAVAATTVAFFTSTLDRIDYKYGHHNEESWESYRENRPFPFRKFWNGLVDEAEAEIAEERFTKAKESDEKDVVVKIRERETGEVTKVDLSDEDMQAIVEVVEEAVANTVENGPSDDDFISVYADEARQHPKEKSYWLARAYVRKFHEKYGADEKRLMAMYKKDSNERELNQPQARKGISEEVALIKGDTEVA